MSSYIRTNIKISTSFLLFALACEIPLFYYTLPPNHILYAYLSTYLCLSCAYLLGLIGVLLTASDTMRRIVKIKRYGQGVSEQNNKKDITNRNSAVILILTGSTAVAVGSILLDYGALSIDFSFFRLFSNFLIGIIYASFGNLALMGIYWLNVKFTNNS